MKIIRMQFFVIFGCPISSGEGEAEKPRCRRDGMVEVSLKDDDG